MYLLYFCAAMSGLAFFLMGLDKGRAKAGKGRIPENTLLAVSLLMGGPGGLLGMLLFRHKTRHPRFQFGLPLLALGQVILILYVLGPAG